MGLIATLDAMAQRYSCLPSECLSRGTTLDLYIMDAAISYQHYLDRKRRGQAPDVPKMTEAEMLAKIEEVRNATHGGH